MNETGIDIVVYSDNADTRTTVVNGVGLKAAKDLPAINWIETATGPGTITAFLDNQPDVLVLDGESAKVGGMAVAREIRDRFEGIPPIVILTARPQDEWLAKWAGACATVTAPLDPLKLQEAVSKAIRLAR